MLIDVNDSLIYRDKSDAESKTLFVLVVVDQDDTEDTMTELWLARDEDHLYDIVKDDRVGEDEFLADKFDEDWGFNLLYKEVGKVA